MATEAKLKHMTTQIAAASKDNLDLTAAAHELRIFEPTNVTNKQILGAILKKQNAKYKKITGSDMPAIPDTAKTVKEKLMRIRQKVADAEKENTDLKHKAAEFLKQIRG